MFDTIITIFQLFSIGFSFGIYGPCLISCAPLLAYFAGKNSSRQKIFIELIVFLTGRLAAYGILGYAAGLSARYVKQFTAAPIVTHLKIIGGVLIIVLGILIFIKTQNKSHCNYKFIKDKPFTIITLFFLGIIIGISPCPPLIALLLEIVLICNHPLQGVGYALAFGMGTFLSGLIILGVFGNIFVWLSKKISVSPLKNISISKIICSSLLILFGLWTIFASL